MLSSPRGDGLNIRKSTACFLQHVYVCMSDIISRLKRQEEGLHVISPNLLADTHFDLRCSVTYLAMDDHSRQATNEIRMRDHWECVKICIWVSLVSFNLGIDTSTVTSMQAMPGFLQVRECPLAAPSVNIDVVRSLDTMIPSHLSATIFPQYFQVKAATACGPDATGRYYVWRDCGTAVQIYWTRALPCVWMRDLHQQHRHSDADEHY